MREKFETRTLTGSISIKLKDPATQQIIQWTADKATIVNAISATVTQYAKMGFRLTLRQLYYQLVKGNVIRNHDTVYKKLGDILDDCRYSGHVDWSAIEDRGRIPKLPYFVEGIKDALNDTVNAYRLDRQRGQENVVEVWTEKDALSNILWRVTSEYHVNLVVNKGYTSSSALYGAYGRFTKYLMAGKKITVLYFGDHDPSGLDMVRDIEDRVLKFFCCGEQLTESDSEFQKRVDKWWDESGNYTTDAIDDNLFTERMCDRMHGDEPDYDLYEAFDAAKRKMFIQEHDLFRVIPIGLTMAQIKQYNLPPNPAKITDPRAVGYIKKHGRISWEVDALNPDVLIGIVAANVEATIDMTKYQEVLKLEAKEKKAIQKFANTHK